MDELERLYQFGWVKEEMRVREKKLLACVAAIGRMVGARASADYYLTKYVNLVKHVEYANEAERAYREADQQLQDLGVSDNVLRQTVIHGIHELILQIGGENGDSSV